MLLLFGLCVLTLASVSMGEDPTTCPQGYTMVDDRCFLYLRDTYTFFQSTQVCDIVDGEVVSITSQADQDRMTKFLNQQGAVSAWLGATNLQGNYLFLKSRYVFKYTNWATPSPTFDSYVPYHCIRMTAGKNKDWRWQPDSCFSNLYKGLLCEVRLRSQRG